MDTPHNELRLHAPAIHVSGTPGGATIRFSIVESPLLCPEDEVQIWDQCRHRWRGSHRAIDAEWQRYRDVVESGRYHFVARKGDAKYGFAEAFVALALLRLGYSHVGTGAYLFHPVPRKAGIRRDNSLAINRMLRELQLPSHEQFREFCEIATDVDLAAYDSTRRKWCFCDAKRDEDVEPKQVAGLALLRLLTGADVGIVRLISGDLKRKEHSVQFRWKYC
jgi:hypothetical protein